MSSVLFSRQAWELIIKVQRMNNWRRITVISELCEVEREGERVCVRERERVSERKKEKEREPKPLERQILRYPRFACMHHRQRRAETCKPFPPSSRQKWSRWAVMTLSEWRRESKIYQLKDGPRRVRETNYRASTLYIYIYIYIYLEHGFFCNNEPPRIVWTIVAICCPSSLSHEWKLCLWQSRMLEHVAARGALSAFSLQPTSKVGIGLWLFKVFLPFFLPLPIFFIVSGKHCACSSCYAMGFLGTTLLELILSMLSSPPPIFEYIHVLS